MGEIQAIIRQITASVTFLPMLEDKCTFDLLVYTKADSDVPQQWCVPLSPRCCPRPETAALLTWFLSAWRRRVTQQAVVS